jgi:hypothetical protein
MCGRFHWALAGFMLALLTAGVRAQPATSEGTMPPVVTSTSPVAAGVTIYRTPYGADDQIQLDWLGGYALITETRDVDLPAGRATLRFEGVAAGMLPESAVITGLPAGVREKNLDADLLSPSNIYARSFGRLVILRRRDPRTGRSREEPAIIRSAPDGAAIVQTRAGFEAVDCGSAEDSLAYHDLPPGLSARPTLSVETEAPAPVHVRLTLSYLAWGFDWRAMYVLRMLPDGRHADLTAWVTLASSDDTTFENTTAAVVAGKPNFDETRAARPEASALVFHCATHPAVLPPAVMVPAPTMAADIVVTAMKRTESFMDVPVTVTGEDLGDLKLYRMPVPTTVSAHAQKQVALFDHRVLTLTPYYAAAIEGDGEDDEQAWIMLRTKNVMAQGLGVALPAGRVTVFDSLEGHLVRVGQGGIGGKAVGEKVEISVGRSPQVRVNQAQTGHDRNGRSFTATVTNANPWPIRFEGKLHLDDGERLISSSSSLPLRDGNPLWATHVPANGRVNLRYRLRSQS